MEEEDLNESENVTESSKYGDDELMTTNNNKTVIRSRNGSFISRVFTSRTKGPLPLDTNGPLNCGTNGTLPPGTIGPLSSRTNESMFLRNNFSK